MSLLDDVSLSEKEVRGLGFFLLVLSACLPVVVLFDQAKRWNPETEVESLGPLRPELIVLPSGEFQMGGELDRDSARNNPVGKRDVKLANRFALARTEITQGQYSSVTGENPVRERCPEAGLGSSLPVVCVAWSEALRFCNELSRREGLEEVYVFGESEVFWDQRALGYRLPTEAEWEYAARATTSYRWSGTDDVGVVCEFGNVADYSARTRNSKWNTSNCNDGYPALAPVGSKRRNLWQIYDMTGNAWEWVWDGWDGFSPYPTQHSTDPLGDDTALYKVYRGGSWRDPPSFSRVTIRNRGEPSAYLMSLGFRVARSLPLDVESAVVPLERGTELLP